MITRPALVVVGVFIGVMFLLISFHNSKTLNNDLMSKLVEAEVRYNIIHQDGQLTTSLFF